MYKIPLHKAWPYLVIHSRIRLELETSPLLSIDCTHLSVRMCLLKQCPSSIRTHGCLHSQECHAAASFPLKYKWSPIDSVLGLLLLLYVLNFHTSLKVRHFAESFPCVALPVCIHRYFLKATFDISMAWSPVLPDRTTWPLHWKISGLIFLFPKTPGVRTVLFITNVTHAYYTLISSLGTHPHD